MPGKRNKIIAKLLPKPRVAAMTENEPSNTCSQSYNVTPFVISCTDVCPCNESINMDHRRPTQDSREEILMHVLKPALHFTALSGQEFYPSCYLSKHQKNLFKVFKSIVLLFYIWNIIRLCISFNIWLNKGTAVVYFNFFLFYFIEISKHCMKFIFNIVYSKKLLEKFTTYDVSLSEQNYFKKLKMEIKLMIGFSTIIIIVNILNIVTSTDVPFTMRTLQFVPKWRNRIFEMINFGILSWFIASGIFSDVVLLYFFVKIICCELHALSQKLKLLDDKEQTTSDIDSKLIHLQKKYDGIMELLHQVNTYFSIYIVTLLVFTIIFSCMLIVISFRDDAVMREKAVSVMIAALHIALAITVLYSGISLQVAVEEPVEYLYRLSLNKEHSQDTMTRISLFFARVSNPSYLTAAKMFNIDSSTILMISGTLLSYGVIVFQTSSVHTGDKNASMTVLTGNMTGNATFG
ncbi:uncharacterized protein LOC106874590 isoform X3 [Octopus bimaculoides]|uniref:uncharacterized protein LOC106874590 isoform X3 n=1 Tax=Octopus bimaculoides TaxID=37653 RepID=UPI0022E8CB16|nr:uncharacterized protein LOC106874590 isoform X3 [Octopus bimaculoides]